MTESLQKEIEKLLENLQECLKTNSLIYRKYGDYKEVLKENPNKIKELSDHLKRWAATKEVIPGILMWQRWKHRRHATA